MSPRAPKGKARSSRGSAPESERVRERILMAFSSKAKRAGIRAVVMGELATDLRMSAMTLYKHFASKDELVEAMIDAWAEAWTGSLAHVSPAFFKDLHRDHHACWTRFQKQIDARKWAAAPLLRRFLRPDLNANVALQMLDHLVTWAADPRSAERLGVSRREAVRTAVSLWGDGALQRAPRLRAVPSAPKSR